MKPRRLSLLVPTASRFLLPRSFLRLCFPALLACAAAASGAAPDGPATIAFWPFDESPSTYPSSVLADHGPDGIPLLLGPGGTLVPGRYGHALSSQPQPAIDFPPGGVLFGLTQAPTPPGRQTPPLSWMNARFAALLTAGENHLRKEFTHPNPATLGLNLGAWDWTVEFWYRPDPYKVDQGEGTIFELGAGPRGENPHVTLLWVGNDRDAFVLVNEPGAGRVSLPSSAAALRDAGQWHHFAFVYDAAAGRLTHYVDGQPAGSPVPLRLQAQAAGEEAYFSVGRGADWNLPLQGALDELRFSRGQVYTAPFSPPASFVADPDHGAPARPAEVTQPLLFARELAPWETLDLGSRKHLLLDDALFLSTSNIQFVPAPPESIELAFEVKGSFRKHVTVIEGDDGLIRLYSPIGRHDRLGVRVSRDGLNFDLPPLSTHEPDYPNIATVEPTGTPGIFLDPIAPPQERWKMVTGSDQKGIFVFTSPDGFTWKKGATAALPFWSGSQSNMFYDDQRGAYLGYHRTDMGETIFGKTERRFVLHLLSDLRSPWPWEPVSQSGQDRLAASLRLDAIRPWYLDNGPLAPGGFGVEFPTIFLPTDGYDPDATDIYVPKAVKYPWAPDTYLAFPCVYFHYEETEPETRRTLAEESRGLGSGPIETQLMTSRDGLHWRRHPRPVWINVGLTDGYDINQTYMAQGMIRRGDEIWMYTYNTEEFHSTWRAKPERRGIFRTIQRLDRFVAAEAPYDSAGLLFSRPFTFTGNRLLLNVDTGATGFIQVGLLHGDGRPLEGYSLEDCVYINGNRLAHPVEWLSQGSDLSALAGQPVRLVLRLRGARLFSLQFTE